MQRSLFKPSSDGRCVRRVDGGLTRNDPVTVFSHCNTVDSKLNHYVWQLSFISLVLTDFSISFSITEAEVKMLKAPT